MQWCPWFWASSPPALPPLHPTAVMSLHSPDTIAPCSRLSFPNAGKSVLLSSLAGLIRWLENMWLSAFQVQVPFLGMEIARSAAGSCVGKHFENWYPAPCSSHCHDYFLCLQESLFCDTRKTRRQNSRLLKKKFLLCLHSVNRLFLPTQHPSSLPPSNAQLFWLGRRICFSPATSPCLQVAHVTRATNEWILFPGKEWLGQECTDDLRCVNRQFYWNH